MPASTQILNHGRYRIDQQIPINGQTAVYEAYDTVNDSNVIVKEIVIPMGKVVPPSQHGEIKNSFIEKAKKLTEVRHEALLHVNDYFSEVGRQYLVLESLDGDLLGDALETTGVGFELADVLRWADQLLDALQYLHNFVPPIVHKSVRPRHIKLTSDNKIKLLAFGFSDLSGNSVDTSISGQLLEAEISYSALEQIWGDLDPASQKVISNSFDEANSRALTEPLTPAADIYSLGATLYHLLTGRKPVDALERAIEMLEGRPDPLKPISELVPDIPPEICDVIRRSMEIKLSDRFDSAAIMRQVLKTAQVRAKEREEEEEREMAEAAEVLRAAELLKQTEVKELLAKKQQEIENEQRRQAELLEQKLREAEEQRLAAERRAAEMERLLKEKESLVSAPAVQDDLLLDIEPLHTSGSPQEPVSDTVADEVILSGLVDELAPESAVPDIETEQVLSEPKPAAEVPKIENVTSESIERNETEAYAITTDILNETVEQSSIDDNTAVETENPVELVESDIIQTEAAQVDVSTERYTAYEPESEEISYNVGPSPAISMPMIAGAVGLVLCFVVIGAWYFIGSSTPTVQTSPSPAAVLTSEQPQSTTEAPVAVTVDEQSSDAGPNVDKNPSDGTESAVSTTPDQITTQRTPTPKPTPQRTQPVREDAPKPTPERRRTVTVDDLINDN